MSRAGRAKLRPVRRPVATRLSGEGRWLARLGETFAEADPIPLPGASSLPGGNQPRDFSQESLSPGSSVRLECGVGIASLGIHLRHLFVVPWREQRPVVASRVFDDEALHPLTAAVAAALAGKVAFFRTNLPQ